MSTNIRVKVDGLDAALKMLSSATIEEGFRRGLLSSSQRAVQVLTTATKRKKAVGVTGHLAATWRGDVSAVAGGLGELRLTNPQPYAAVIEYGRRKGSFPPLEPLMLWVRRVLRPKARKGARKKRGALLSPKDRAIRQVAFAVGSAIKKRGTPARNIMGDSLPKIASVVGREVADEIIAVAKRRGEAK